VALDSISRRELLQTTLLGVGTVSAGLLGFLSYRGTRLGEKLPELMGPLLPTVDETSGLPLLLLPEGFKYRTFSWAGESLHDGRPVPGLADGMGVVRQQGSRITLVRNHELRGSSGAIGAVEDSYDITGGGTTTLVFDTSEERLIDSWVSLSGTLSNCAGGVTPWGTWLSCEEGVFSPALRHLPVPTRQYFWDIAQAQREHGFVFEVPAEGVAEPTPILPLGQFYHEAVAIDPRSGISYMTEDTGPRAGFYRYIPEQPGHLAAGGKLQMMNVDGGRDMRDRVVLHQTLPVTWVDIDEPQRGFTRGNREGDGVVRQGLAAGGSAFIGLEGCAVHRERVYFTSKLGGRADAGYVFGYDPEQELITLLFESPGNNFFSGPDNIVMSPRGSLVICEDRVNRYRTAQSLAGLTADGTLFRFCQINRQLDATYLGHKLHKTLRNSEWAGVTFSQDGQWLFCNLYDPGATVAITGPWQQGLI